MKKILFTLLACGTMFSCTQKDLYDPDFQIEKTKKEYEANFIKKFGEVPADFNWDMSTNSPKFATNKISTRSGWIYEGNIIDGRDDSKAIVTDWHKVGGMYYGDSKGIPFTMTVPDDEFTIVPFSCHSDLEWELHMVVGNADIPVWYRGDNFEFNLKGDMEHWLPLGLKNTDYTIADQYRAKGYTFNTKENPLPKGEKMYMYLRISYTGEIRSSTDGYMAAYAPNSKQVQYLSCVPEGYNCLQFGCSDGQRGSNNFVFIIYSKSDLPEISYIDESYEETFYKRYMIEDLGETDDFDFNDIVVDVEHTRTVTPIYNGEVFDHNEYGEWKNEKAIIKHFGGTIPFQLKIGETVLPWITPKWQYDTVDGQWGYTPRTEEEIAEVTFDIKGWDHAENNITCSVVGQQVDESINWDDPLFGYDVIYFPERGKVPTIFAFDQSTMWMKERQQVPIDKWFYYYLWSNLERY